MGLGQKAAHKILMVELRQKGFRNFQKGWRTGEAGIIQTNKRLKENKSLMYRVGYRWQRFNHTMRNFQRQMFMGGISTLFFGMAIQRAFMGIINPALKQYMKVNGDVLNQTSETMVKFQASWKGALDTVGAAILGDEDSLVNNLSKLLNKIEEFAQKNPDLTSGIIDMGIAIGTTFFSVATFMLGISGLLFLLSHPVTGLIAVILGVGVAAYLLNEDFRDLVNGALRDIVAGFEDFKELLEDVLVLLNLIDQKSDELPGEMPSPKSKQYTDVDVDVMGESPTSDILGTLIGKFGWLTDVLGWGADARRYANFLEEEMVRRNAIKEG